MSIGFDLNIEEAKETFIVLAKNYIKRDGIDNLLNYLIKSDFFTAPASSKFHLCRPGGLCMHSINVFNRLVKEVEAEWGKVEDSPYSMETITLVSLMHDLCKIDYYKPYKKNVKNEETGKWEPVDSYKIEEKLPIAHSFKSQYILRSYVNLSREESVAIMSHMGGFDTTVKGGDFSISNAFKAFPLALLLHVADLKATNFDETM